MKTPNPRGFPTASPEAALREFLPEPVAPHWSFDPAAQRRATTENRLRRQLARLLAGAGR